MNRHGSVRRPFPGTTHVSAVLESDGAHAATMQCAHSAVRTVRASGLADPVQRRPRRCRQRDVRRLRATPLHQRLYRGGWRCRRRLHGGRGSPAVRRRRRRCRAGLGPASASLCSPSLQTLPGSRPSSRRLYSALSSARTVAPGARQAKRGSRRQRSSTAEPEQSHRTIFMSLPGGWDWGVCFCWRPLSCKLYPQSLLPCSNAVPCAWEAPFISKLYPQLLLSFDTMIVSLHRCRGTT